MEKNTKDLAVICNQLKTQKPPAKPVLFSGKGPLINSMAGTTEMTLKKPKAKYYGLSNPENKMLLKLKSKLENKARVKTHFFNELPISVLIAHCIECTSYEEVEYVLNSQNNGSQHHQRTRHHQIEIEELEAKLIKLKGQLFNQPVKTTSDKLNEFCKSKEDAAVINAMLKGMSN